MVLIMLDAGYEPDFLEDEVGEGRVLERHVRIGLMGDEDGDCTDSEANRDGLLRISVVFKLNLHLLYLYSYRKCRCGF